MGTRAARLRETLTRERNTPDALKGISPEYLLSERLLGVGAHKLRESSQIVL